jgi:hypothetical protein
MEVLSAAWESTLNAKGARQVASNLSNSLITLILLRSKWLKPCEIAATLKERVQTAISRAWRADEALSLLI